MIEDTYCLIYRDPQEKVIFGEDGNGELPIRAYHWDDGTLFFPKEVAEEILNRLENKGFKVRVGRLTKIKTVSHHEIVGE